MSFALGTPTADYTIVKGVDLRMKTPKPKDSAPAIKDMGIVDEEIHEICVVGTAPEAVIDSKQRENPSTLSMRVLRSLKAKHSLKLFLDHPILLMMMSDVMTTG